MARTTGMAGFGPSASIVLSGISSLVACTFVGCAFPIPIGCGGRPCELVSGYASTHDGAKRTRRVVPGVDVRLGWLASGLSLGWSDLRLLEATAPRSQPSALGRDAPQSRKLRLDWPAQLCWRSPDGGLHRLGLFSLQRVEPEHAFAHHVRLGASLLVGRFERGLEVGFSSATALRVPLDRDGIHRLRYRSRDLGSSSYTLEEEGP